MWGITTYFNPVPGRGELRLENYRRFRAVTRSQSLKLCAVELCYDDAPPDLVPEKDADLLIHVRASRKRGVLWQKERLLNIALEKLPSDCTKICWLDADLIFSRSDWVAATEDALNRFDVVQPFSVAFMLPRDWHTDAQELTEMIVEAPHRFVPSVVFASLYRACGSCIDVFPAAKEFQAAIDIFVQTMGGTPGLCWAAKRSVFARYGFYDRNVVGGGDAVINAAVLETPFTRSSDFSPAHAASIERYLASVHGCKTGCVDGLVLHMWHGKMKNRKYAYRHLLPKTHGYDPDRDLVLNTDNVWEWSPGAPQELIDAICRYFDRRKEDAN